MVQTAIVSSSSVGQDICSALERDGFRPLLVQGIQDLLVLSEEWAPGVVLLDYTSLGRAEVEAVLQTCRDQRLPVLALVPGDALADYDVTHGSDDFLVVPCTPQEVVTRIQQLLWRLKGDEGHDVLHFGDLRIDRERYEVSVQGRPILLTYKEYQLLLLLASTPGRVYSRETLLRQIWSYDYLGGTRTVDVHIRRLRSKLADAQAMVETVWNVGYRFRPPRERRSPRGASAR